MYCRQLRPYERIVFGMFSQSLRLVAAESPLKEVAAAAADVSATVGLVDTFADQVHAVVVYLIETVNRHPHGGTDLDEKAVVACCSYRQIDLD
jgi:hypothetical protein